MSKIKDLRNNPDNSANIVDFISLLCPENKESKYVPLFLKFMKETTSFDNYMEDIIRTISENYGIPREKVTKFTPLQLVICYLFYQQMFNETDLKRFQKFCDYNEKNMIPNNDLTKYKSFTDIKNSVDLAEIKMAEKEMEKSIKSIHRDDEWIVLRPLTYQSSKKYGWNTKWCTSSEDTNDQFINYSRRGILIYTINTKTGLKVACFKELNSDFNLESNFTNTPEFSFWNQVDHRIDSIQSGLPQEILNIILNEVQVNPISNKELAEKMDIPNINDDEGKKMKTLDRTRLLVDMMNEPTQQPNGLDIEIDDYPSDSVPMEPIPESEPVNWVNNTHNIMVRDDVSPQINWGRTN
jgi:hypothetical protein